MAEVVQRTEVEVAGPWLLNKEALLRMDNLLDEEFQRLKGLGKEEAAKEIRRNLYRLQQRDYWATMTAEEKEKRIKEMRDNVLGQYRYKNEARKLTIETKSGRQLAYA